VSFASNSAHSASVGVLVSAVGLSLAALVAHPAPRDGIRRTRHEIPAAESPRLVELAARAEADVRKSVRSAATPPLSTWLSWTNSVYRRHRLRSCTECRVGIPALQRPLPSLSPSPGPTGGSRSTLRTHIGDVARDRCALAEERVCAPTPTGRLGRTPGDDPEHERGTRVY
jgi:hypothetical protein